MKVVERKLPEITISNQLFSRAKELIPAGTQTLAKGPGQFVNGVAPKYLNRGKGCIVWDVDGNEFIDLIMGVGPISLGYCYPAVDDAIREQLEQGITFSMMHPLELEVAEMIRDAVPNAESIRFSKTGADVTSAAIRLARAYTGRSKILCCGYHGWHDWYISVTDRHSGIPPEVRNLTCTFDYNNIDSLERALDESIACVILEPVTFEAPQNQFLEQVRELCTAAGALLIFDEMWTGFRLSMGGAQKHFGIDADLSCFSKAIANGMPISVLTGRRDVMRLLERDVFFFTTFGGEALSLAAAEATMIELKKERVPEHIALMNQMLRDAYNILAKQLDIPYTKCVGLDYRTMITFDAAAGDPLEMKSLMQQELLRCGVIWSGVHNLSLSHRQEHIAQITAAYKESLSILKRAVEEKQVRASLHGDPVEPLFRRLSNFHQKPSGVNR